LRNYKFKNIKFKLIKNVQLSMFFIVIIKKLYYLKLFNIFKMELMMENYGVILLPNNILEIMYYM